jgi:hypothetical protein
VGLNLGDITFGVTGDTAGLRKAIDSLELFGTKLEKVVALQTKQKDGIDAATRSLISQEGAAVRALQQVENLTNRISNAKINPDVASGLIDQAKKAAAQYAQILSDAGKGQKLGSPLNALASQRQALGFQDQIQQINRAFAQEEAVAKAASAASASGFERQALAVMRAEFSVQELLKSLERLESAGRISPNLGNNLRNEANQALAQFSGRVNGGDLLDNKEMLEAQQRLKGILNDVKSDMSAAAYAGSPLKAVFQGITDAAMLSTGPLSGLTFRLRAFTDLVHQNGAALGFAVGGVVGLATGFFGLGAAVVHSTIQFQQSTMALNSLYASTAVGAYQFQFLMDTANKAGQSVAGLASYYTRFQAAATSAGQSLKTSNAEFAQIAMIGGRMHLPTQDVGNAVRAFDEMLSRGFVQTRDVVRMLANDLPGAGRAAQMALTQLAQKGDITRAELEKLGTQGKITGANMEELFKDKQVSAPQFVQAFLKAYTEMMHIDPSKNIDSVQASLNRLSNSWMQFTLNVDNAIKYSDMFKAVVDALTAGLNYFGSHVQQVVVGIVTLGGALAGLFIGLTIVSTVASLAPKLQAVAAAFALVTNATEIATAAQLAFNTVMDMNPIMLLVSLLGALVGALVGATAAQRAMTSAIADNKAVISADMDSIDDYIKQQEKLGVNIDSVTDKYLRQREAFSAQKQDQLDDDLKKYAQLQTQLEQYQEMQKNAGTPGSRGSRGADYSGYIQSLQGQIAPVKAEIQDLGEQLSRNQQLVNGLKQVSSLPDQPDVKTDLPEVKTKNPNAGLGQIERMVQEASSAKERMNALFAGPESAKLLDDLDKAKEALFEISGDKDKSTKTFELLHVDNLKDATSALASLIGQSRVAKESMSDFVDVWTEMQKGLASSKASQLDLGKLASGGDPTKLKEFAEAAKSAEEQLAKFNALPAGAQNVILGQVTKYLDGIGIHAKTADEAMILFWQHVGDPGQQFNKSVEALSALSKGIDTYKLKLETLKQGQGFDVTDNLQKSQEALKGVGADGLKAIETMLQQVIQTTGDATADLAKFYTLMDAQKEALQEQAKAVEDMKKSWQGWADRSITNIEDVLLRTKKLKDAVRELMFDLFKTVANQVAFNPLKNSVNQFIGNAFDQKTATGQAQIDAARGPVGGFTAVGMSSLWNSTMSGIQNGIQGRANPNTAVDALADASSKASTAIGSDLVDSTTKQITQMTTQSTGMASQLLAQEELTTSFAALVTAAQAASQALFTVGASSTATAGSSGALDFAAMAAGGRAVGGPVQANKAYFVSELGSGDELFIPGQSGTIQNGNQLGQGGSSAGSGAVDARTYIDARGATQDAIASLRQEMQARESRIYSRMPSMIDYRVQDSLNRGRIVSSR